jgi:hypothetical protein
MYFVFINENRTMKPVEIFLGRLRGEKRKNNGGVNLTPPI